MTKAIDTASLLVAPVIGYFSTLLFLEVPKEILALVGLDYPALVGLSSGFVFVVISSYGFMALLGYFFRREEKSEYVYNRSISLVCLLLAGLLVRMFETQGGFTTMGFLTAHVAVIGLAVIGFPGWNVSLMLTYNILCMLVLLPLIAGITWLLNTSVIY